MKISIKSESCCNIFEGDEYIIDLNREFGGYEPGDLICEIAPWAINVPLILCIAIRKNGNIIFRNWSFGRNVNQYLHTQEVHENDDRNQFPKPFVPTQEQIDTVNGLWSGRIKWEGLKIAVGASVQQICPINVEREEELIGQKILLAR